MRTIPIALAIFALLAAPIVTRAADPAKAGAANADKVDRTVKIAAAFVEGRVQYAFVTPAEGGPNLRLALVGDAQKEYLAMLKGRGELFNVTIKPGGGDGTDLCTAIAPFDGPKGLKSPKAWIFDGRGEHKIGVQMPETVKLKRFGHAQEAVIPNKAVPGGGKPAPDPVLMDRLKSLKPGDCVEVELQAGPRGTPALLDIDIYREPQLAEFVKLDTIKEGGKSFPAIVLNVDEMPQTLALPSAAAGSALTPAQSAVVSMVRKLKPGCYVQFTSRDVAGRPTLRDLRLDASMHPTGAQGYELLSTFVRIRWRLYGTDADLYFSPRSARPEDQVLHNGLQWAINNNETGRIGLDDQRVKQITELLDKRIPVIEGASLPAKEKIQWVNACRAWAAARDDAERAQIEQQLAFAALDISVRIKKDVDYKYTMLRSMLDDKQLEQVKEFGKRSGYGTE
jgi:hypothetical protein